MTFIVCISRQKCLVKLTRRARGHFLTLIESCMHVIECNAIHITFSRLFLWLPPQGEETVKPLSFARVCWSVFYRLMKDGKLSQGRSHVIGCSSIAAITVEPTSQTSFV